MTSSKKRRFKYPLDIIPKYLHVSKEPIVLLESKSPKKQNNNFNPHGFYIANGLEWIRFARDFHYDDYDIKITKSIITSIKPLYFYKVVIPSKNKTTIIQPPSQDKILVISNIKELRTFHEKYHKLPSKKLP